MRQLPCLLLLALHLTSRPARGLRAPGAARKPRLELLDFSKLPPAESDGAMHIATVACLGECDRVGALIQTLAAQARLEGGAKPVLHVFLDRNCAGYVQGLARKQPEAVAGVDLRPYDIMKIQGMPTNSTKHGKPCTMVRLHLPRLFPRLERLVYLDMDVIILNSLRPLWGLPVPVLSMGENNDNYFVSMEKSIKRCPTWRNGTKVLLQNSLPGQPATFFASTHGLNAGVLLFNLTGWRMHNLDREVDFWMEPFASGELDLPMNDQDILNFIVVRHADYHAPLPCEANIIFQLRWMCLFSGGTWEAWEALPKGEVLRRNAKRPTVLHSKFGQGTRVQMWRYMFDRAIESAHLVNALGLRNASSLCDVFGCDSLVMEEQYPCPCIADTEGCACDLRSYAVQDQTYPHVF
mmetsp:Transcript_34809/g.108274  ORF Transcript_34809/g.108274 Transcript_34809/m.108274 type:complete len:408 (-) Transcript_34809:102-1325(-)